MNAIERVEWLHSRYAGVLYDLCVRLLGDRSEAEDAVQETFVDAFKAIDRFEGDKWLPWLYRIATNRCFKTIRTRKRKGAVPIDDVDRVVDARPAHADVIASRRVLEQIIDEQDERGLSILVAHFVHGMTQEEIAAWLGVSRRAVVKRLTVLRTRYMHLFQEAFA